jgi:serine/threonine protein kinase
MKKSEEQLISGNPTEIHPNGDPASLVRSIDLQSGNDPVGAAGSSRSSSGIPSDRSPGPRELLGHLAPGTVIDGKYTIASIIGRGGMGVVVAARHHALGRDVALKFLCCADEGASTEDLRSRFRREAQINARLRNEHITRILDVGSWQDSSYMVLELLEGMDLRCRLKQSGGTLPQDVAIGYAMQICEGMAEAHAHGIVHRDLKPANLFLTHNADGSDLIKIMDFGISKWRNSDGCRSHFATEFRIVT